MAEEGERIVRPKRIFINNLDSYVARNIGKYLSTCVAGASLEEAEEGGEEEEQQSDREDVADSNARQGLLQVVGTLSDPAEKLKFPVETYVISSRDELLNHLLESDVIIYNITEEPAQIQEASWAMSGW